MSSETSVAIRVDRVSKSFKTFGRLARLRDLLVPAPSTISNENSASPNAFRALDNVSFQVERGTAFGIMGQNGSGKSTLLQIISGIMTPSAGSVTVNGKVAALLELGSGFNPEFTGIENVYLNASVLGLSKSEIDDKLDAILSFADIGEHVGLPVKTYSSGMMLRLAFAVQVAIEPEILIIDEALAVGDAKFQLKCFRRLEDLKSRGTTILFVSHATELVKSFCDSALVLEKGKLIFLGDAKVACVKYYETMFPDRQTASIERALEPVEFDDLRDGSAAHNSLVVDLTKQEPHTFGVGGAELSALRIEGIEGPNVLRGGKPVTFVASFRWQPDVMRELIETDNLRPNITLGISIANNKGIYIFGCNGFDLGVPINCLESEKATVRIAFTVPLLAAGDYFLSVAIALGEQAKHVQLKWYDCFVPLGCMTNGKTVYGMMAVDYSFGRVEEQAA
jgi:lipopolysaccharide transport system ATP-binding protein